MSTKRELEETITSLEHDIRVIGVALNAVEKERDEAKVDRDNYFGMYVQAGADRDTFFAARDDWKSCAESWKNAHGAAEEYIKILEDQIEGVQAREDEDAELARGLEDDGLVEAATADARLEEIERAHSLIERLVFASRFSVPTA